MHAALTQRASLVGRPVGREHDGVGCRRQPARRPPAHAMRRPIARHVDRPGRTRAASPPTAVDLRGADVAVARRGSAGSGCSARRRSSSTSTTRADADARERRDRPCAEPSAPEHRHGRARAAGAAGGPRRRAPRDTGAGARTARILAARAAGSAVPVPHEHEARGHEALELLLDRRSVERRRLGHARPCGLHVSRRCAHEARSAGSGLAHQEIVLARAHEAEHARGGRRTPRPTAAGGSAGRSPRAAGGPLWSRQVPFQ